MSGDFFNDSEKEFDESRHLSSREIWEGLAKHLLVKFDDIVTKIEKDCEGPVFSAEAEKITKEMGIGRNPQAVKAERDAIEKKLKLIKEYNEIVWAEQKAVAFRKKNPRDFLEKRKQLTWKQEEIVNAFKNEFIEEILKASKKIVAFGSEALRDIETRFEAGDGGILPPRKASKLTKEVHPEFIRTLNESTLGANVLSEGFFKILKQEREIIDDRLYGGKKERPY